MYLEIMLPLSSSGVPKQHVIYFIDKKTSSPLFLRITVSISPCTTRGLPCHYSHLQCGKLLPHHFTLTVYIYTHSGLFSVALSVGFYCYQSSPPLCYKACCSLVFGLSSLDTNAIAHSSHTYDFLHHIPSVISILPQCSHVNMRSNFVRISTNF